MASSSRVFVCGGVIPAQARVLVVSIHISLTVDKEQLRETVVGKAVLGRKQPSGPTYLGFSTDVIEGGWAFGD